jgi:type VI secretion system protein VasG
MVNLKSLIGRLNQTTREALENAAGLCAGRSHYNIEVEHFFSKLLDVADSDFAIILKRYGVDKSHFSAELTRSLDRLKTGNARNPSLSDTLIRLLSEAWNIGSIDYQAAGIRSGFVLLALLDDEQRRGLAAGELQLISRESLRKDLLSVVAKSRENEQERTATGAAPDGKPVSGKTPFLDQYTNDLTAAARAGKLDTILGRDKEIRQAIDILMRRRQNNPILTGEAGVGKTAVVEGLAQRIASGDVPESLRNVALHTLDLALLQAGAGIKGEFENRLKGLIDEVKRSPSPIVLFIDEAHTMIGAGGQAGQNDAANLLKPALARGELRTVAATTWSEYKKYFEKDAALARRFQVVKVEEPDEDQCAVMLRGVAAVMEDHHRVRILDQGLMAAVRLSHRYLAGRQLPDKAVSVLDTACARLALGQNSTPPAIENATRELEDLNLQERVLRREMAAGADHTERLDQIAVNRARLQADASALRCRWEAERSLISHIRDVRAKLEQSADAAAQPVSSDAVAACPAPDVPALREQLDRANAELATLQGEEPLLGVNVDAQVVSEVISGWTGIPVGKMLKDEVTTVLELRHHLSKRVVGQDDALEIISRRIQTSRAGLDDPAKPVGVFLLVGPSGVGKTETALALSDLLYGGERNLITINMSEFQEAHTVSTLKGSPPGYVGYGEGGVLTEAVRRRPYSVVLLDEAEKAHSDVLELFYQVFDKGRMEDGEGREIDFKNTIIILTSNAATDAMMKLCDDPETMPSPDGLVKALRPELNRIFKPAFLGRLVVVPFLPIRDAAMKQIIELKLGRIKDRLLQTHRVALSFDASLVAAVASRCTEVESGARNVDSILTNSMLPDISRHILVQMAEGRPIRSIQAGVAADGSFSYS